MIGELVVVFVNIVIERRPLLGLLDYQIAVTPRASAQNFPFFQPTIFPLLPDCVLAIPPSVVI